jgi:argininosuccinate lyase
MAKKPTKNPAAKKPWGGRFTGGTDADVEAFTESVSFDYELALFDIAQSRAHSEMLAACGIISKTDLKKIHSGLKKIGEEIRSGRFDFKVALEDVHMNIESRLAELIGPAAGRLHTARSRNAQVVTDLKLYLREAIRGIRSGIRGAQASLVAQAERHAETLMPGYTHTQRAQPVPLGHHLMAYFFMLERDAGRFADCAARMNTLPLGAGALAGTALPTDPRRVAKSLGFAAPADNSIDAVSDRDFAIEFLAAAAICMNHLSRACEELVLWMSPEFGFVSLPDALCTGSSIMPQKKNPDVAELIRGKNGRVVGGLVSLLIVMKALPLAYNRDMQEDKEPVFDAAKTVAASLRLFAKLAHGARFNAERMAATARTGLINAVDLTDHLVLKGVPFREAHSIVGRLVPLCVERGIEFRDLTAEELRAASPLFGPDAAAFLEPAAGMAKRTGPGAASPASVRAQIKKAKRILERES